MEFLLKTLSPKILLSLLPMILIKIGTDLKNKDENTTGKDDIIGTIFVSLAPAVAAFEDNQETTLRKSLKAVRDAIDAFLKQK